MTATVAEVTASAADFALTETFAQFGGVQVEVERVVAQDDRIIPFVWVRHEDIEAVHRALEDDPTTANVEVLTDLDDDDERLYRMEWIDRIDALVYALVEEDGTVLSASAANGRWVLRLLFADREALGRTYDHCQELGLDLSIDRVFNLDNGRQGRFGLTEKQQDILESAFEQGYYSVPREISAQDLAVEIDISHQALSERLRRAHETLVENTVVLGRGDDNTRK
jgi:hypothetical protein